MKKQLKTGSQWKGTGLYLINSMPYEIIKGNFKAKIYPQNKENLAVFIPLDQIENQCKLGKWVKIL